MKKIIFTLVCLLGMSVAANAASKSDIVLQHGSNITVFNAEDLASAMEAAVDGDVIFLGEGIYPSFGINKKITVQGVGLASVISGNIEINIPNEPVLTAPVLQYLRIDGGIYVNSATKGLGFKQCRLGSVVYAALTYDAYIDRCESYGSSQLEINRTYSETITINGISNSFTYPKIKGLTVTNSRINEVWGDTYSTNVTFVNCWIGNLVGNSTLGTVINSMIMNYVNTKEFTNTKLINSYIFRHTIGSNSSAKNCYFGDEFLYHDSEQVGANNYLGDDGTIVGPLGGTTPLTLEPDVPLVTVSNFKVDHQKQELNVTLTATPE